MKKKILIITIAVVVALIVVAGGSLFYMFHQQYAAAQSVEQVGDKMYTMTYEGDYGLDDFLEQGGASSANEIAAFVCNQLFYGLVSPPDVQSAEFGCSFITTKDKDGNVLTGRNFDWPDCKSPIAIIHTRPDNGYASVSTSCVTFLGFGDDWKPEGVADKMALIAALYAPLDGMNEKGLVVFDSKSLTATYYQYSDFNKTYTTAIIP